MKTNMVDWMKRAQERREWAAAHPEESAALDARIEAGVRERELRAREVRVLDTSRCLQSMGVPCALADELQADEEREFRGEARKWKTKAMDRVRSWMQGDKRALVLLGGVGAGKSAAAAWTLLGLRDYGLGIFIGAANLARMSKFDDGLDQILDAPRLVIDDLGAESNTPSFQERFLELVNVRLDGRTRTVFTSNLNAEEIKARYGDRVSSRLRAGAQISGAGDVDLRNQR